MKILLLLSLIVSSSLYAQVEKDTTVIFFPFNKYHLTESAKQELQNFLEVYQSQPSSVLTMYGHCDSVGSHEYNDRLSLQRIQSVKDWLVDNGIDQAKISTLKGFGKRMPLNDNATDEDRSLNRRVEIIFDLFPEPETKKPDSLPAKTFSRETIEKVKEGEKLVLPMINFQGGLHRFMPGSMPSLEELLRVMKENPKLEIEIQGHICCRAGSDLDGIDLETNKYELSENRARAVFEYLFENGIDKKRMKFRGMGGRFPIVWPERSESDRTTNRRVEILILKK